MCVIISKPSGVSLEADVYDECFVRNKDGAGIAYVKDGKIVIEKGFFTAEALIEAVKRNEGAEMIVHCRIATHGTVDKDNCHPFFYESKWGQKEGEEPRFSFAIAHNGVLHSRSTKEKSDTRCFVEDTISEMFDVDPWFLDRGYGIKMVEDFIGMGNKLVIMRYDSKNNETSVWIVNERAGTKDLGCWFSNHSYKRWKPVKETTTYPNYMQGRMPMSGNCFPGGGSEEEDYGAAFGYIQHPITGVYMPRSQVLSDLAKRDLTKSQARGALSLMQQGQLLIEEQRAKLERNNIIPLEGGINLTPEKEESMKDYLTKSERSIVRRFAHDYMKYWGMSGLTNHEACVILRDDLRDKIEELKDTPNEIVDRWVLDQNQKPGFNFQQFATELQHA